MDTVKLQGQRIFHLSFINNSDTYICTADKIGAILKDIEGDVHIRNIKEFDYAKQKFKFIPKRLLKTYVSWHTESKIELEKLNYI